MNKHFTQIVGILSSVLLLCESLCYFGAFTWASGLYEFQKLLQHEKAGVALLGQLTVLMQNGLIGHIAILFLVLTVIGLLLFITAMFRRVPMEKMWNIAAVSVFSKGVVCLFTIPFSLFLMCSEALFAYEILFAAICIQIILGWLIFDGMAVWNLCKKTK